MISSRMPFASVPCAIWLPFENTEDDWGNSNVTYSVESDIQTTCCYAPGRMLPNTADDIEDGRPHGLRVTMTFYLPKTVDADLRDALIACYPTDDQYLSGRKFQVIGQPYSYPRANTPGDYSWAIEAVDYLG